MSEARRISDANVAAEELLPTPAEIKAKLPLTEASAQCVLQGRREIERLLDGRDSRLMVVVGPCSIHDLEAAKEYAARLKELEEKTKDALILVMRVYFAKPRTTVGWKGLINDPFLDDSFRIDEGLARARQLLLELTEMGLYTGTEALDSITPQFIDDVVVWNAIGARTAESQTHREMASGLSTPVGIKNGTDGNIKIAINALQTMRSPHHFLGINQQGQCIVLRTRGNRYGHIILRGGERPNYDSVSIAMCVKELHEAGLAEKVVVDCSHGNSLKDFRLQPLVAENCVNQILDGNRSIVGLMLESNLFEGNQEMGKDPSKLRYGVSITDSCLGWEKTEELLLTIAERLRSRLGGQPSSH